MAEGSRLARQSCKTPVRKNGDAFGLSQAMTNRLNCILFLLVLPSQILASEDNQAKCYRDEAKQLFHSVNERGVFQYWEENPGSSHSQIAITHHDQNGDLIWETQAERGCSQGVSRCYLDLGYILDGESSHDLRIEMNYFSIAGTQYLVFSHLEEQIISAYSKWHPFQKFALAQSDGANRYELEGEDYTIPNLFWESACN